MTTSARVRAVRTSAAAPARSSALCAHGYGASPMSAIRVPRTRMRVICPGRPVDAMPLSRSAAAVSSMPPAP